MLVKIPKAKIPDANIPNESKSRFGQNLEKQKYRNLKSQKPKSWMNPNPKKAKLRKAKNQIGPNLEIQNPET